MRRFRSFNHSTCKTVLNQLEAVYLRLRKIVVDRVTVVTFRVDNRCSNGTVCFRIKVRTDTAEITNMRIAGHRKWWDLIRESKIFIKDKTKVACRMSGVEWKVVNFRKLLFKTNNEKFSLRRVKSNKITDMQEEICKVNKNAKLLPVLCIGNENLWLACHYDTGSIGIVCTEAYFYATTLHSAMTENSKLMKDF